MRILTRRRLARGALAVLGSVVLTLSVVHPAAYAEEPEQEVTTSPGDPAGWEGTLATGTNTDYDAQTGEPCGDDVEDQCETVLLHVEVPDGYWDQRGGGLQVHLDDYLPNPASDFDLYIYRADADGSRGEFVTQSADLPGMPETAEIKQASGDYLVQVVYFAVTASTYTATTEFVERDEPAAPPDVDSPLGLQDVLASDPDLGFRSHSEPHIAQSPTNPDLLIAGSKMYNRDQDSLAEYEFKVGTYVSFDGGRSWSDLGQTGVCPPSEAPPGSWPENDCYPDEDPQRAGTGGEDADDPRVGGDFGEEYITSDPWVHFDDDGTAYLMVLDSPPFDSGTGWGMSFHRWRTPSPQDLASGQTWSDRIVINNYPDDLRKNAFLDDKNTFAVNNAGPDHDGKPGTMIACWGQNIVPLIKQQQVCERSTDGGKTWPGDPVPISGAQQLEIGVHVVADKADPETFYAMWLHYVPGIVGAPDEMWLARTTDGGQTWQPPVLAAQLTGIPRQFPGQEFRNLSLPSMAAGPNEGELYAVYADYRPAQSDEDEDGMQADIMLITSSNGGMTWSSPVKVNTDDTDADQFQPAVAVTPAGQVNVTYFDRRHDPANLFIDTYLSRSNDGGASFTDVRVSHDMWDPRINPPISGSGEFIGDYQGLVVDNCAAIPFVNDTHLANDRSREPRFDHGVPRSPYQEVFSWRVPNTHTYGGRPVPDTDCDG